MNARCTFGEDCSGGAYERFGELWIDPALCDGAPVYQLGGGDGPVLYRVGGYIAYDGNPWNVGDSTALERCSSDSTYLNSVGRDQRGPPTADRSGLQCGKWVGGPRRPPVLLHRLRHRHRRGRALAKRTAKRPMRNAAVYESTLCAQQFSLPPTTTHPGKVGGVAAPREARGGPK